MNVQEAFDATGLNVYAHVVGFGRTKSISYRLFASAFNENRVRRVTKTCRAEMQNGRIAGILMYTGGDMVAVRVRKAARKLRYFRRLNNG